MRSTPEHFWMPAGGSPPLCHLFPLSSHVRSNSMTHAIRFHQTGGPEDPVWKEVKPGKPGPGEARISHTAGGLNFLDIYNRSALYPRDVPSVLAREGAGELVEVGPCV